MFDYVTCEVIAVKRMLVILTLALLPMLGACATTHMHGHGPCWNASLIEYILICE